MTEKDFHVTVRIRNGRIIRRMHELGIFTLTELARRIYTDERQRFGVQSRLSALIAFKERPITFARRGGDWTSLAMSVSAALGTEPENLWPEHLKALKARRGEIGFYADEAEVRALPSPGDMGDRLLAQKLLTTLSPKERLVIERHYGITGKPMTYDEIADELLGGVSRTRVMQLENKALYKMKKLGNRQSRPRIASSPDPGAGQRPLAEDAAARRSVRPRKGSAGETGSSEGGPTRAEDAATMMSNAAMLRALDGLVIRFEREPPNLEETRAQLGDLIGILIDRARAASDDDAPAPTPRQAEADAYLASVERLEPDLVPVDVAASLTSIAISLRRIVKVIGQ